MIVGSFLLVAFLLRVVNGQAAVCKWLSRNTRQGDLKSLFLKADLASVGWFEL